MKRTPPSRAAQHGSSTSPDARLRFLCAEHLPPAQHPTCTYALYAICMSLHHTPACNAIRCQDLRRVACTSVASCALPQSKHARPLARSLGPSLPVIVVCMCHMYACPCGTSCHMPTSSGSVTVARRECKEGSKIAHNCPQLPRIAHNCHDLLNNA